MSCVSFAERTNQFQVINYFQLYLRGVFRTLSKTSHLGCLTLFWIRLCLWYFCCKIYSSRFSYRFQGLSENCQKSLKVLIYQSSLRKKENLQTITQKSLNSLRNIKTNYKEIPEHFSICSYWKLISWLTKPQYHAWLFKYKNAGSQFAMNHNIFFL